MTSVCSLVMEHDRSSDKILDESVSLQCKPVEYIHRISRMYCVPVMNVPDWQCVGAVVFFFFNRRNPNA